MSSPRIRRERTARLWTDTGPGVRTACLVMWVGALGTAVVGLTGDRLGWWVDAPYLTNLMSSLTSALFGVPVAVLVLQRIVDAETYRRERQEALRFADLIVQDLHRCLTGLSPDPATLTELTGQLQVLTEELLPALPHRRFGPELARALAAWQHVRRLQPRALADPDRALQVLSEARSQWWFLRGFVEPRLRRYDFGTAARADTERLGRLIATAITAFGGAASLGVDFAEAADRAAADGSLAPLTELYDVDDDAAITVIEEHVEELARSVNATADLLAAAAQLGQRYRLMDRT